MTRPIEIRRLPAPYPPVFCDGYGPTADACWKRPEYDVSGRKVYALCGRCAARAAKRWGMALPVNPGDVTMEDEDVTREAP